MKVLVACEESQAVCIAFRKLGHEAYSCDTQECSGGHPEWHIKKTECRSIMKVVDDMMYQRNFRRISLSPIPNMENATIYRLVARYVAITDGTTMYRR